MLTYKRSDNLEVIGYSDAGFVGCDYVKIVESLHQDMSSFKQEELFLGKALSKS
jgi:hypothetical protein